MSEYSDAFLDRIYKMEINPVHPVNPVQNKYSDMLQDKPANLDNFFSFLFLLAMNHRINSRQLPLFIERLAKEGYTINIEHSRKLVRITCDGNALRHLIPFGQTRLTEFGG